MGTRTTTRSAPVDKVLELSTRIHNLQVQINQLHQTRRQLEINLKHYYIAELLGDPLPNDPKTMQQLEELDKTNKAIDLKEAEEKELLFYLNRESEQEQSTELKSAYESPHFHR